MESLRSACSNAAPSGTCDLNSGVGAGNSFHYAHGCRALFELDLDEGLQSIQLTAKYYLLPRFGWEFVAMGRNGTEVDRSPRGKKSLISSTMKLFGRVRPAGPRGPFERSFQNDFLFLLGFPMLRRALVSMGTFERSCRWGIWVSDAAIGRRVCVQSTCPTLTDQSGVMGIMPL